MVKLVGFNRMDILNAFLAKPYQISTRIGYSGRVEARVDVFGCAITKIVTLEDAIQHYCPVSRDLTGMAESRLF